MLDHRCVRSDGAIDNDYTACVEGMVYTTCGHENCTGVCVDNGDCDCACHDEEAGELIETGARTQSGGSDAA